MILGMREAVFNSIWVLLGLREIPAETALTGVAIILTDIIFYNFMPEGKNQSKKKNILTINSSVWCKLLIICF
jgi:type III secretory pathway component EscR